MAADYPYARKIKLDEPVGTAFDDREVLAPTDVAACERDVLDLYRSLLKKADITERDTQAFFERYPSVIPQAYLCHHGLWRDAVMSKLQIGTQLICDFAYLTKTSLRWRIVFVELESPKMRFFKGGDGQITPHSAFTNASAQIASWRIALHDAPQDLLKRLNRFGLQDSDPEYRFVLIAGRSADAYSTEARKAYLRHQMDESRDMSIFTYDSVANAYASQQVSLKNVVTDAKGGWTFKNFVYPGPNILVSEAADMILKPQEIEILSEHGFGNPPRPLKMVTGDHHKKADETALRAIARFVGEDKPAQATP